MGNLNLREHSWMLTGFAIFGLMAGPIFAQNGYPTGEINFFGGVSRFFAYQDSDPRMILDDGPHWGIRGTWNATRWVGLEGSASYGQNNLRLTPAPGGPLNAVRFASHTGVASFGPVLYLVPPESPVRLFLKAGIAGFWFNPTEAAQRNATNPANVYWAAQGLDSILEVGALTGVGIKARLSRRFGLRADLEAGVMPQPHFRLPSYAYGPGAVYVPTGGTGVLYRLTGGFYFAFGGERELPKPVPTAAPEPPKPPAPEPALAVDVPAMRTITACPGEITSPVELAAKATTNLPGHSPSYRWTVNGQPVGANQAQYAFPVPSEAGQYRVAVTVSDDPGSSEDKRTAAAQSRDLLLVNVSQYAPPTIEGSAGPGQIELGGQSTLTITPQGTQCNRQMTYNCTAPEGTLSGTPPNRFDSTGVTFEPDRSRLQTKVVNISCTVKDATGGTGTTTVPVTVTLAALPFTRLDDVIFRRNDARVNNCGKRILLEELYPQLTEHPDWDVVLVGHVAPGETGRQLDRRRVLNVIASLTAGRDTCPSLEPSRIRFSLVGSDQTSQPRPGFCGTTTRGASTERTGQTVSQDDPNAQFRRVEVYLVPRGGTLPPGATALENVPLTEVQALGCPR
jgi:hypothetical protein